MRNDWDRALDTRRGIDLPFLIRRAARCFGDSVAADDGIRAATLGEAVARAERVANALDDEGIPPGACVGILSENRSAYVEADLAIALGRRVRVALNARLHLEDHRYVAADCGMRVLVHSARFAEEAEALQEEFGLRTVSFDDSEAAGGAGFEELAERGRPAAVQRPGSPEDPAWITYTSGTTGRPKGIVLSHRSIREVALNLLLEFGPVEPGELLVLPQPLSHGAGYWVLPCLISGAGVYVMRKFDPDETCIVSERPNVRTLKCVPAMLPPLIEGPGSFGYETIIYGASPMPQPVLTAALDRFGPVLVQVYGQSEAPVTITCLGKEDHLGDGPQRFSAGRPFRAVGVEVWDEEGLPLPPGSEGEVAVTGSHLMSGYLGMDEETAAVFRDGWLLTRDMGMFDERGFLRLLGRRDEMIISGGYNISPREVENVLSQFPGVEEVAVVGIPDQRWGSVVGAAVKMVAGVSATSEQLIDFAKPRLTFRAPRHVAFVEAIPKTPYGKVDRPRLLQAIGTHLETAR
jgi:fatty-acyl-CoA synthase